MKVLRITGVPEHFNFPWVKVIAAQPFLEKGVRLEWIEESRGSGQMNKALSEDETELAIILTESFLKAFEAGGSAKIIGFHVNSPLIWGIHLHGQSPINSIDELINPGFLISRFGSGSELMAKVLAEHAQWDQKKLTFKVVDNLPGALKAMTPSSPELFLWEKYTTKPWVDLGELKRIGEVPSPWPCFVTVASNKALSEFGEVIRELRDLVYAFSQSIQNDPLTAKAISEAYELKESDVKSWLNQTSWANSPSISKSLLEGAMEKMMELGIINSRLSMQAFLKTDWLTLQN